MKFVLAKTLALLSICISGLSFGQSKNVWLYDADTYYQLGDYASALKYYHLVLDDSTVMKTRILPYESQLSNQSIGDDSLQNSKKVSVLDYVHHQIAICYRNTYDYELAAVHFKASFKMGAYPEDRYYYANALMNLSKYDAALKEYTQILISDDISDEILTKTQLDMSGCYYATNPSNNRQKVIVTLADTGVFNKGTSSFGAMYWGHKDKIIFTSAREKGVVYDPLKQDSKFLCDLYWTEKIDDTTWGVPHNFGDH